MDRLVEAVAEYLCRHRSVGLLRLTLDLTRLRLDLFAEVGAVEVVSGAVAAVREAAYAPLEGPTQYMRKTVNWTSQLKKLGGLQHLQRFDPPLSLLSNLKFSHTLKQLRSL